MNNEKTSLIEYILVGFYIKTMQLKQKERVVRK